MAAFLDGPMADCAGFAAAGWFGAAMVLMPKTSRADSVPAVAAFPLAQMLRATRGPAAALVFLGYTTEPQLVLVRGEGLIALGRRAEGLACLQRAARLKDPAGVRATYLLAAAAKDDGRVDDALRLIQAVRQ